MASYFIPKSEVENERTPDQPNWIELPKDITANILQRLSTIQVVTSACKVCPYWWNICKDPIMWRTIRMTNLNRSKRHANNYKYNLFKICRNAIERSCGQLEDIAIDYFATDDLLAYIADCAGHLRRMRLAACEEVTNKGFTEALKKLSLLEELEILYIEQLSNESLEIVGQFCPLLKSLKYSMNPMRSSTTALDNIKMNNVAFIIAKTMHGLQHLKIYGEVLNDDGVLAILDGCLLLKSLDLQLCYNENLSESMKERCRAQIKDLRLPLLDYSLR